MISNLKYLDRSVYNYLYLKYFLLFNNLTYLNGVLSKWIIALTINSFSLQIEARKPVLPLILFFLQKHTSILIQQVVDITAVDYLVVQKRFQVIYQGISLVYNTRITCIVNINDHEMVPSITPLYSSASWFECEIWDLFGIYFEGHKNIHRLLTDYGFRHYPLRKDFPLSGYNELFYNESKKMVGYYRISIVQEFRNYSFLNPWLPLSLR